MEKWVEIRKGGDFAAAAERFGIDPLLARLIRNRDIVGDEAVEEYLHGTKLYDPHLMKDLDKAVEILSGKIHDKKKLRVIGDYDIDGINASYILVKGISNCGGTVDTVIPDRQKDGYGINEHLISQAAEDGVDTIVTCDNGISAIEAINYGKSLGMTMIVTDHHDIPFEDIETGRVYLKSDADAIVNPKQQDCPYPYKGLCGAVVAWKLVWALYEKMGRNPEEADEFYENAAFATVGDVMDLTGENRIIVKEGLKRLHRTSNPGMRALILQNGLNPEDVRAYHIGFVLGPCMNASGRLDTAKRSLALLNAADEAEASVLAADLIELNKSRKDMTEKGLEEAVRQIEEKKLAKDRVMVVYLPDCHESLAGIIAGRIRERYHRPVFVLTQGEEEVKGSGRSIEAYSMYEEMVKCRDLFLKFGGHPMAAGLSIEESKVEEFRRRMNENCTLTEEELIPTVKIDAVMPLSYITKPLIHSLELLEPFGKGNAKPVFAERNVSLLSARVFGKNRNVLKLELISEQGYRMQAVRFGDPEEFFSCLEKKYSGAAVEALLKGKGGDMTVSILYYPKINEYNGEENIQIVISSYR